MRNYRKLIKKYIGLKKVITKKRIDGIIEHALVKWSGYSDKHNQWIPVSELEKINGRSPRSVKNSI